MSIASPFGPYHIVREKLGGSRPVALLCLVYRVVMKLLAGPDLKLWDAELFSTLPALDLARAGHSAGRASALRQSLLDAARWRQLPAIQILWDLEKFYDTGSLEALIPAARAAGFDLVFLVLLGQLHTAPRLLTYQDGGQ